VYLKEIEKEVGGDGVLEIVEDLIESGDVDGSI